MEMDMLPCVYCGGQHVLSECPSLQDAEKGLSILSSSVPPPSSGFSPSTEVEGWLCERSAEVRYGLHFGVMECSVSWYYKDIRRTVKSAMRANDEMRSLLVDAVRMGKGVENA